MYRPQSICQHRQKPECKEKDTRKRSKTPETQPLHRTSCKFLKKPGPQFSRFCTTCTKTIRIAVDHFCLIFGWGLHQLAPPARTQTGTKGKQQLAREQTAHRARRRCDTRKARLEQRKTRRETIGPNQCHAHFACCGRVTFGVRLAAPTTCRRGGGSGAKGPLSGLRL